MTHPITSSRFPYLAAQVSIHQTTHKVEALIDTGFSGYVIMPPGLVTNGEPPDFYLTWSLANDSRIQVPAYLGSVRIGTFRFSPVVVGVMGNEPIVGTRIISAFKVVLDHGRRVTIEP